MAVPRRLTPEDRFCWVKARRRLIGFAMGEIEMIERFPLVETSLEAPAGLEAQAHETMVVSPRYRSTPDHDGALLLLLAGLEP